MWRRRHLVCAAALLVVAAGCAKPEAAEVSDARPAEERAPIRLSKEVPASDAELARKRAVIAQHEAAAAAAELAAEERAAEEERRRRAAAFVAEERERNDQAQRVAAATAEARGRYRASSQVLEVIFAELNQKFARGEKSGIASACERLKQVYGTLAQVRVQPVAAGADSFGASIDQVGQATAACSAGNGTMANLRLLDARHAMVEAIAAAR